MVGIRFSHQDMKNLLDQKFVGIQHLLESQLQTLFQSWKHKSRQLSVFWLPSHKILTMDLKGKNCSNVICSTACRKWIKWTRWINWNWLNQLKYPLERRFPVLGINYKLDFPIGNCAGRKVREYIFSNFISWPREEFLTGNSNFELKWRALVQYYWVWGSN